MSTRFISGILVGAGILVIAFGGGWLRKSRTAVPVLSATPPAATPSVAETPYPTPAASPSPTASALRASVTPTPLATTTPAASPASTPVPTQTFTPTLTPAPTPTPIVSPTPVPTPKPQTYAVLMEPDRFNPSALTIRKGDMVRFVNLDTALRWPASDPHPTHTNYPAFDSLGPVDPGSSYSLTFTEARAYSYHDHLLSGIGGTIVVTD